MLITNDHEYQEMLYRIAWLEASDVIGIDTETTGVALWTKDVLRGVCIGFQGRSYYVPVSHPDSWNVPDTEPLREALAECAAMPLYANAPFDFRSLEAGIGLAPPMGRYRDVQVISWLQDENAPKALKKLGERFFGEDASAEQRALKAIFAGKTQAECYRARRQYVAAQEWTEPAAASKQWASLMSEQSKRSWDTISAEDIAPYAAQDADLTVRVYEALLRRNEYAAIEPAVQKTHDVQAAAYRMTRRGVAIDVARAEELRCDAVVAAIGIDTGFAHHYGVEISSTKQLQALIYETWGLPVTERTDGGAPSCAAAVLEAMAGEHPGLDRILEYRRLVKAGQFYDGLLEHADAGGRVHTGFQVNGTVTGRWSSREPNLQQIPKESTNADAKKLFVAAPGMELVSYDLVSAELFVAASLANDEQMMAALSEPGRNMHKETALAVFGSEDEPYYTIAKNLNYGTPYGIGPTTMAQYIAKGRQEKQRPEHHRQAKEALLGHSKSWPVLHRAMNNAEQYADLTGRLPLGWPGRFRHFTSDTMKWPVPAYRAFNSAVQGGVAMLVNDVLLGIEGPAAGLGAVPVLAVHDSLVFEAEAGTADRLGALLQGVSDDLNPFRMRMLWGQKLGV